MWRGTIDKLFMIAFCVLAMGTAGDGAVIYVDAAATGAGDGSSWADAYVHLQDALAATAEAPKPIEIRVAQGIYKPDQGGGLTPGDRDATFELIDGVTLRGGYAGVSHTDPDARDIGTYVTVLSGDLHGDDDPNGADQSNNCRELITIGPTEGSVVIDGFRIIAASWTAVSIEGGSSTIRNCTFRDNASSAISGWNCRLTLTNCIFRRNGRGQRPWAAIYCRGPRPSYGLKDYQASHVELKNCVLNENDEGAIETVGTLDLVGCTFTNNIHGAVSCQGFVTARRCTFSDNIGSRGAAIDCPEERHVPVVSGCALVDSEFLGNRGLSGLASAVRAGGASLTATGCVFLGNSCDGEGPTNAAGAILSTATVTHLSNCLFAGNQAYTRAGPWLLWRRGAVHTDSLVTRVTNCTFVSNRGKPSAINLEPGTTLTQCIVWDCPSAFDGPFVEPGGTATYSNIQGGFPGEGNIDVDPCFVDPGLWQTGGTPDDPEDDVWIAGDYHLKSQAGHWDEAVEDWVYDETTSPCIDAGDPNGPLGNEPFPNGAYVNIGAYGGTTQASRAYFGGPVCETHIAGDINGDCQVDDLDMDILQLHWLMPDIGRANTPPTVSVLSPVEGAELSPSTPVFVQADAFDADGTVLRVTYLLIARSDQATTVIWTCTDDPTDNWARELSLLYIGGDRVCTIWAGAIDNEGAMTFSAPITAMLRP